MWSANPRRGNGGGWKESIMSHENSALEVGRPYFVVSKQEEESGGVDKEFVQISKRSMDTLLEKAQLATALTTNSTTLVSKVLKDMNGEVRNIREEMAEMSLRVERLERNMPLGCEESGSSSGGGEWVWWSGAWWVKTKTKMNSASRRKVHRAISQSLGRSSEKIKLCEEKTSGTDDDDDAKSWRKLGRPEQMMFDSKKSRRAKDEQADSANGMVHFRNASKAEGACVDT